MAKRTVCKVFADALEEEGVSGCNSRKRNFLYGSKAYTGNLFETLFILSERPFDIRISFVARRPVRGYRFVEAKVVWIFSHVSGYP